MLPLSAHCTLTLLTFSLKHIQPTSPIWTNMCFAPFLELHSEYTVTPLCSLFCLKFNYRRRAVVINGYVTISPWTVALKNLWLPLTGGGTAGCHRESCVCFGNNTVFHTEELSSYQALYHCLPSSSRWRLHHTEPLLSVKLFTLLTWVRHPTLGDQLCQ